MSANFNSKACGAIGIARTAELKETKWTAKKVEEYFLEVILTLKKLPPVNQRGYFNLWPDIMYSHNEIILQKKQPMYLRASSEAIDRLEKTFEWMSWLSIEERKLVWKRAARAK